MELKNRRCYLVGLFGSGCSIFFSGIIHSNKQASEIPSNKALFQKRMKLYIQNIFPIINFSVQSHCTINWTICPNYCIFFWLVGTELNYPSRVTNCQTIDQSNSNLDVRTVWKNRAMNEFAPKTTAKQSLFKSLTISKLATVIITWYIIR